MKPFSILAVASVSLAAVLTAAAPSPAPAQSSIPEGSYQLTCRSLRLVNGYRLSARCQRADGSWNERSNLDMRDCRSNRAENINGELRCERGGWRDRRGDWRDGRRDGWDDEPGRGPGGGADVELYEHVDYQGRRLVVNGSIANFVPLGWNDIASSIRVNRGVWRLCEHVDYQGRCRTFSVDEPNFVPLGANDLFSSIQRVR